MIYYLWDFKPNETNNFLKFNQKVVEHNQKFIPNYTLISPNDTDKILESFPEMKDLYLKINDWIVQTDLIRLLVIYLNGGMYCDIDCFLKRKIPQDKNVVLFVESICPNVDTLGPRESKHPENRVRIANYCFVSKNKKHAFFKDVIDECVKRLKQLFLVEKVTKMSYHDILWCCGPDVITSVYHRVKKKYPDIFLSNGSHLEHRNYGSWKN